MRYLLFFGNPYLKGDNLIVDLADELKIPGYAIVKCTSPEEIMFYADKEFIIVDVAKNISEPIIITDPDQLNYKNIVSLHDFDLNFFLKLYKELGHKVKILAIPFNYKKEKLKKEMIELINI